MFGDPQAQKFYWTGHNPTALVESLRYTRVFVAVGDGTPKPGEVSNYFGALAETDLRQHAIDFVNAARATNVDVTYDPRQGIHDWPYWRQHLADALQVGLLRARRGASAGVDLHDGGPVEPRLGLPVHVRQAARGRREVRAARHADDGRRSGDRVRPDPGGATFSAKLPFDRALPSRAPNRVRDQRLHRRKSRR